MFHNNENDRLSEKLTETLGDSITTIKELIQFASILIDNQIIKDAAHKALLERYLQLVNCGDCGNWDPEKEDVVIESRRVLKYEKDKGPTA